MVVASSAWFIQANRITSHATVTALARILPEFGAVEQINRNLSASSDPRARVSIYCESDENPTHPG